MGIQWTKEQNRIICERGGTLLVSASAGSGKTTVMLERVIKLIDEGYSLANMLVSTFTNAAAEDMRLKLYRRLRANNEDGRYNVQLSLLPQADICTLHSWCQKVIKSHFYAVDVDPGFEILDTTEAKVILQECISEALEAKLTTDAEFVEFYDALLVNRRDNSMRQLIEDIIEFAFAQPNTYEWLDNCLSQYSDESGAKAFVDAYDQSRKNRLRCAAQEFGYRYGVEEKKRAAELADFLDGKIVSISRLVRKSMDESVVEEYVTLRDKCKKLMRELNEYVYAPSDCKYAFKLIEVVKRVIELFCDEKRKRVKLDYNDLERYALQVLNNPIAGTSVRSKYEFVFVDEYQDINPLQESIISSLNADGKLFLVGDIKQSIYAFRLCNPQIFVDKYNKFKGEGRAVELNANFRSDERILKFCNRVFSSMMTEEFGRVNYARDAMFVVGQGKGIESDTPKSSDNSIAKSDTDNSMIAVNSEVAATAMDIGGVEVKIVNGMPDKVMPTQVYDIVTDDGVDTFGAMDAEVNLVADKVLELIQCKISIGGVERNVALKDIAILLRSPGQFGIKLYNKLKLLGIDTELNSSLSFVDLAETNTLISYLKLIDNHRDDVNLAAVMLSQFGGFDEEELAQIASSVECEYFYERVRMFDSDKQLQAKIANFLNELDYYTAMSASVATDQLAGCITADYGYFEYLFSLKDGATKAANLDAYLKTISDCPSKANVSDYIDYIANALPTADRAKSLDAVKIMTIHASKGLEFPFVILADTSKKFNLSDCVGKIILSDRFGMALKNINLAARQIFPTYLWRAASIASKRQNLEEEMRVLYVALTRAKMGLYIFGRVADKEKFLEEQREFDECDSYLKWLKPFVMPKFVDESDCVFEPPVKRPPTMSKPNEQLTAKIMERLDSERYRHNAHLVKSNVTALAVAADDNDYEYTAIGGDTERAAERGTAYHKFMELIDFVDAEQSFDKVAVESGMGELVDRSEILDACRMVLEIKGNMREYREQSFIFNAPLSLVGDGEGNVLTQGVIDLLLTDGRCAVIVDYKTTSEHNLNSPTYTMQCSVYRQAVEKILKLKVDKTLLYSFKLRKFIEIA